MESNTERLCDLITSHKELEQEEIFLTQLLTKIDKQIHALQVEQLTILNSKSQTEFNSINCNNMIITGDVLETFENEGEKDSSLENGHELDLRPIKKYMDSEEDEEDEDFENEKDGEFPNNSADFEYL